MTHLLLTGGTGTLGRALIDQLKTADFTVRVLSRHSRPANLAGDIEWAQADLATGAGLNEALIDVSTIVHAASDFTNVQAVNVTGTVRLIEAARLAHAAHLIYVSIVGIDRIQYPYYTAKVAAEKIIMENAVPWTIVRATQFHDLIDSRLQAAFKTPVAFLPVRYQYQSIAVSEVASELVKIARQPPSGRAPDIGGPQVLRYGDMARDWLRVQGRSRQIILPKFPRGSYAHAFTHGYNTCPQNRQGRLTWQDWLHRKYR